MKTYLENRKWSDQYIPEMRRILSKYFWCKESEIHEDIERDLMENTDLILPNGQTVACRVRKNEYLYSYRYQFTFRYSNPFGCKTEFEKMLDGYGDWLFYSFAENNTNKLSAGFIGNLDAFRLWYFDVRPRSKPLEFKQNEGDNNGFVIFRYTEVPNFLYILKQEQKEIEVFPKIKLNNI